MQFRTFLGDKLAYSAAATALLFAAPAIAQNSAYVDQIGSGNSASVVQDGEGNRVGDATADRRALQNGDDNTLDIDQGGGDTLGTGGNYQQNNIGLDQDGNNNTMTVDQSALGGSELYIAQQVGDDNEATVTQAGNAHVSTLSQTGNDNTMSLTQTGSQYQQNTIGDAGGSRYPDTRGAFQTGNANDMTIAQSGPNNYVVLASQTSDNNIMDVSQSGSLNRLQEVSQDGLGNEAMITQIGTDNGRNAGNNGDGVFSGDAAGVGVAGSTVTQTGDANFANLMSDGDENLFGVAQNGNDNSVFGIQTGSNNEAAWF